MQTILSIAGGFEGGAGVDISDTSGLDFGDTNAGGSQLGDYSDVDFSGDGGNPADFNIGSMFTLQGIVTFLTVFSWSAIVAVNSGVSIGLGIVVAIGLGIVAMYSVAKLLFASRKLTENGTLDIRNSLGHSGRVYIPIPANQKGGGKINLNLQGRFVECSAITLENQLLPTGTLVRVIDVRDDILVVEQDKL